MDQLKQRNSFRITAGLLFIILAFPRCGNTDLKTATYVDLPRYMGTWYEIAALPAGTHKNCHCTSFDYKMSGNHEYIMVINSCIRKGKQGAVLAKAYVKKESGNAVWKMEFFRPFYKSYSILAVDTGYAWAMAGLPDRKSLWLLSRTKEMDTEVYHDLVKRAADLGYPVGELKKTIHTCSLESK